MSRISRGSLGFLVVVCFLLIFLEKPFPADALGGLWASADPVVAIEPAEQVVEPGATLTVRVTIEQVSDLGAYEFEMKFDPSVVEVLDVKDGGFLGSTGRTVIPLGPDLDSEAGTVAFGAFTVGDASGAAGAGELATISLEAVGEGITDLDLYDVKVADTSAGRMVVTVEDGRVKVGTGPMPTHTPTVVATATATKTPTTAATGAPAETPVKTPTAATTGAPTRTVMPGATAPSTRTPQAGQTQVTTSPTVTPSPTLRASSGPAGATPEPGATSTHEVAGISTATEVPPTTPPAALASEGDLTPTPGQEAGEAERPAEGERDTSGTGTWLVGGAVVLAIAGIIAIAVGVYLLAPRGS